MGPLSAVPVVTPCERGLYVCSYRLSITVTIWGRQCSRDSIQGPHGSFLWNDRDTPIPVPLTLVGALQS